MPPPGRWWFHSGLGRDRSAQNAADLHSVCPSAWRRLILSRRTTHVRRRDRARSSRRRTAQPVDVRALLTNISIIRIIILLDMPVLKPADFHILLALAGGPLHG